MISDAYKSNLQAKPFAFCLPVARVFPINPDRNFSLFQDDHFSANPNLLAKTQSLVYLLKAPVPFSDTVKLIKNSASDRRVNTRKEALPVIKPPKKQRPRQSPYCEASRKIEEKNRLADFLNFNDFVLTAKTMKLTALKTQDLSHIPQKKAGVAASTLPVSVSKPWKFFIGEGNNGELVRRILMETRAGAWQESKEIKGIINFKWQQNCKDFKFERMTSNALYKQMVNHFEFHREISTKAGLFMNLRGYCEKNKLNLSGITPPTFFFELESENFQRNIDIFLEFYTRSLPLGHSEIRKSPLGLSTSLSSLLSISYKREDFSPYTQQKMSDNFQGGANLWLFKPNGLNRGRGIKLFNRLEQFEELISDSIKPQDEKKGPLINNGNSGKEMGKKLEKLMKSYQTNPLKPEKKVKKTIVVQKYIEKPLLISGRKFDIRVWSLITHELDFFFFREGYIRTSSERFTLESQENHYVHLTNNAVQKNGGNYGKFEDGNQLSFDDVEVAKKLNKEDRSFCFEIFGYDFLIDAELQVWLIEVNTNPCIETSSKLLESYIPRMLDDAFKLTLDRVFPAPLEAQKPAENSIYPIKGRENSENLWYFSKYSRYC